MHTSLQDPGSLLSGHPLVRSTTLEGFLSTSERHVQTLHAGVRRTSALARSFAQDLVSNHKLVPKGHENIPVICSDKSWIKHFQVIWCSVWLNQAHPNPQASGFLYFWRADQCERKSPGQLHAAGRQEAINTRFLPSPALGQTPFMCHLMQSAYQVLLGGYMHSART